MKRISVSKLISRANSNLKNGQFDTAEQLFAEVLMSFPNNVKAQQGLRRLTGDHANAFTGTPPQKLIDKLIQLINEEQLELAVTQANNLVIYYPKSVLIWNILGIASAQIGQFDQAIKAFERIITFTPNQASAYYNLGNVYKDKGLLQQAVEAYTKALELKPNYDEAYNNLIIAIEIHDQDLEKKQIDAIEHYQKLLMASAQIADKYFEAGLAQHKVGKLIEAIDAYEKAIEQHPNYSNAYNNMGIALKDQGKLEEAITAYKKAIAIKPDNVDSYNNMGIALNDQGKLEEAIEAFKKAVAIKPDYANAYNNMGNVLKDQGKLEEAITAYKKAIAIKPDNAESYNNTGLALHEQGKLEEAIEAFKKAVAIKPDYANIYSNMGASLKDQGKLEEAIEACKKAIAIEPDNAEAYNNIGLALHEQGKLEEAIKAYKKAVAIKPDYAEAYSNLSFTLLLSDRWREGIEIRKWRFHTKQNKLYQRFFGAPEWDGQEPIHNKTLLIWGEQGPGDVVIWSSCIDHLTKICGEIIVECHPKLVDLLTRSFPKALIRSAHQNPTNSIEDFDFHIPMETLFGYACLTGACTTDQPTYLRPDPERVEFWINKLRGISDRKVVGISWKSPVMTVQRSKNYPELTYWGEALQDFDMTFVNLQSLDFKGDMSYLHDHFGCKIIHMEELDLYDDLSDVAAFSQALDCTISVATAAATISAAVGTHTIIPTWAQSPWNNILFTSRGPSVDILEKNTSESWGSVFEKIKAKLIMLEAED